MRFLKNFNNEVAFNNEEELKEAFLEQTRNDGISCALEEMCIEDSYYLSFALFERNTEEFSAEKLQSLRNDVINQIIDTTDMCWYVTDDEKRLSIKDYFSMDTLIQWIIDDRN